MQLIPSPLLCSPRVEEPKLSFSRAAVASAPPAQEDYPDSNKSSPKSDHDPIYGRIKSPDERYSEAVSNGKSLKLITSICCHSLLSRALWLFHVLLRCSHFDMFLGSAGSANGSPTGSLEGRKPKRASQVTLKPVSLTRGSLSFKRRSKSSPRVSADGEVEVTPVAEKKESKFKLHRRSKSSSRASSGSEIVDTTEPTLAKAAYVTYIGDI